MNDRLSLSIAFLKAHGWGAAERQPLADDASFRRYYRLQRGDGPEKDRAVLMDAPPEFEDVRPFVAVALHLQELGLAAPAVIAIDLENGFLLLEDMGDALFARVIDDDRAQERPLYQLAIDGLVPLHKSTPPRRLAVQGGISHRLPLYDMDLLLQELALFIDWYVPALSGKPLAEKERNAFLEIWQDLLSPVASGLTCLTLRDYHAENLMLRPNPTGGQERLSRLGLLDFQDAVIGHPAYDLVSLLQDARRDVSIELEQEMLSYYLSETGLEPENFRRDYALLGAQRNAKIIGIFTRLFLRDGKRGYLQLIPRVWASLTRDLDHPALAPVRNWMDRHISSEIRTQTFLPQPFMPQKAMILAAGLGQRMRPLSAHCPKPLIQVAGKAILSYTLEGLTAAGVRDVVINMHYLADQVAQFTTNYYDHRLTFTLSDERQQLLDSGGGVKKALEYLGEAPFFVLNSDMIWRDGTRQMLHRLQGFWQDDRMDILMLLVPRDKAFGYDGAGDYHRDDDGRLTPRGQDMAADHVYGGILIMKPACFADAPDGVFSLRDQFNRAAGQGRLFGVIHDGEWYHVGTPEARDQVEDKLEVIFGEAS